MKERPSAARKPSGVGQLSLVEHALCPLDTRSSLVKNLVFDTRYYFTTAGGMRTSSRVRVFCPLGLSATDELYLWGLLALTLAQPDPQPELFATPHWCLRQLGVINQASRRGGRQYRQFAEALRRLSTVTYISDGFYDPVRAEHRRVSLGFFSYSLPEDDSSGRAWLIVWDPLFFRLASATAGHLRFDLALYRQLDTASRRLFLFASKVLSRCPQIRAIPLEEVGINLLGFSPTLTTRQMTAKVRRCLQVLTELQVLVDSEVFRTSPGRYFVRLARGPYFSTSSQRVVRTAPAESPMLETLLSLGFDSAAANRLIGKYPSRLLSEWIDITQAAIERFGPTYFKRSPMAFLVDSVSKATIGQRTPPDWWQELRKTETQRAEMTDGSRHLIARIRTELFGDGTEGHADNDAGDASAPLVPIAEILAGRQSSGD